MKKKTISLITAIFLLLTVFAVPSFATEQYQPSGNGFTWSEWTTTLPAGVNDYETKTQYRYREKSFVNNGYYNYSGYTRSASNLVSTVYGNWSTSKATTSDKEGSTYRTIVSNESKSANYAYMYVCGCKKWFWKNNKGSHKNGSCVTKNVLKIYSSKSLSGAKYSYDSSDGSYKLPKTIGTSYPGNLGTVYLTTYNGARTSYFTSAMDMTYFWQGSAKTIYRAVTKKYQYTHWKWGNWSSYSDSYVSASTNREVETRTLYRYKLYDQTINVADSFYKTYGDGAFSLNAYAMTPLTYSSSDTGIAAVSSSGVVTIKKAGIVTITINAASTAQYNGASKNITVNISKAYPQLQYSGYHVISKTYGDKAFTISATAKSGVTYSSSDTSVATISSKGLVTIKKAGNVIITIKSAKPESYYTEEAQIELNISKASQNITCEVKSTTKKSFGAKSFSVGAKAKTNMTYSTSDSKIATVSSTGKVTLKNPGEAVIIITAKEGTNYTKATKKITVKVSLKSPSLTAKATKSKGKRKAKLTWTKPYGAQGYELYTYVPSSKSGKTTYIKSGDKRGATISGFKKKITYKYKIRAYRVVKGKKVYSSYTPYKKIYFSK